jgi:hypothetical protein
MLRPHAIILAAFMLASLSVTGCGRLERALTPPPTVVTLEATVAAPGATVQGDLPGGVPVDLPLWPSARVMEADASGEAVSMTLLAQEPFSDVLAGVAKGLSDSGWDVAREEAGEDGSRTAILTVAGDTHEGLVTIIENDDATVTMVYVLSALD